MFLVECVMIPFMFLFNHVFGFCRSHAQLQKLGEHLGLDASGAVGPGHEDDSKINTVSDDMTGGYAISPLNEVQIPSHRKRSQLLEAYDVSNNGTTELYSVYYT